MNRIIQNAVKANKRKQSLYDIDIKQSNGESVNFNLDDSLYNPYINNTIVGLGYGSVNQN